MKSPWMPDYLGGSLQTLGALPGANTQRSPGELQADFLANQDRMKLAEAMMGQGYIENSGWLGVLSSVLGTYQGKKIKDQEQKKLADLLREESDMLSAAERRKLEEKAQQDAASLKQKMEAAMAAGYNPGQAQAVAQGIALPKAAEPKLMKVGNQLVQIGADGKPQVIHEAPQAPQAADRVTFGQPFEVMDPQTGKPVLVRPRSDGGIEPVQGFAPKPAASDKPPELTGEVRSKVALMDNALRNAQEYLNRVRGDNGEFKDLEAYSNDTPQLIKNAIQDMLYVKTGASAPAEEVNKAFDMYGPGVFERDSTALAKAENLVRDLQGMRGTIVDGVQRPGASSQPEQRAVNPQTGEVIVLRNGKWVPE